MAAKIIIEGEKHAGKSYVITGPESISYGDMAKILSEKLGTEIKYVDLPPADLGNAYKSYGMSDFTINALLELDNITKLGYVANLSHDVREVTGRQAIAFGQFVEDHAAMFKS